MIAMKNEKSNMYKSPAESGSKRVAIESHPYFATTQTQSKEASYFPTHDVTSIQVFWVAQ
jgi:hypothetical protein